MANIQKDCPHCRTPRAPFWGDKGVRTKSHQNDTVVLMQCGICAECIIVKVRIQDIAAWLNNAFPNAASFIIESWPTEIEQKSPAHTPGNVSSFYLQGTDSLSRRNFDAAGTMFRKALDAALRKVHPNGKGTLEKRINSLPDGVGITPAMKEWAHNIRDLGNDAAHEEEPFEENEAKDLQSFTELFLTYLFTLPGMVEVRRSPTQVSS